MEDVGRAIPVYFRRTGNLQIEPSDCCKWMARAYLVFGGRFNSVTASFRVKNGVVWTKSFSLATMIFRNDGGKLGGNADILFGGAYGDSRLRMRDYPLSKANHPEYTVRASGMCSKCSGFCTGCELITADFTPFVAPEILSELFDFNLSCLTRWRECEEVSQMMSGAWKLLQKEDGGYTSFSDTEPRCHYSLDIVGRDFKYASVSRILTLRASVENGVPLVWATLEPVQSLKNGAFPRWRHEEALGRPDTVLPGGEKVRELKAGSRVILLYDLQPDNPYIGSPLADSCGIVTYSVESLALIRKGIERDVLSESP
jgi:hypothetical protein